MIISVDYGTISGGGGVECEYFSETTNNTTPYTIEMQNGYVDVLYIGSPSYCYARGYVIDGVLTTVYQGNATLSYSSGTLTVNKPNTCAASVYKVN